MHQSRVEIFPNLGRPALVIEDHNPAIKVVVGLPVILHSVARKFDVSLVANHLLSSVTFPSRQ